MKNNLQNPPNRDPWLKQPNEPENHYTLFYHYLTIGRKRTLIYVADENQISYRQLLKIAKKYDWLKRAAMHDRAILKEQSKRLSKQYADSKYQKLELTLEIYATANKKMKEFNDFLCHYVEDRNINDRDKHMSRLDKMLTIFSKHEKLTQILENYIEKNTITSEIQEDESEYEELLSSYDRFADSLDKSTDEIKETVHSQNENQNHTKQLLKEFNSNQKQLPQTSKIESDKLPEYLTPYFNNNENEDTIILTTYPSLQKKTIRQSQNTKEDSTLKKTTLTL